MVSIVATGAIPVCKTVLTPYIAIRPIDDPVGWACWEGLLGQAPIRWIGLFDRSHRIEHRWPIRWEQLFHRSHRIGHRAPIRWDRAFTGLSPNGYVLARGDFPVILEERTY